MHQLVPVLALAASLALISCGPSSTPGAAPTAPAIPSDPQAWDIAEWIPEGESADWESVDTGGNGTASVKDHEIHLGEGPGVTAMVYKGKCPIPIVDYELSWEGKKVAGSDFFAAATFPVRSHKTCATFINGGWGGGTTGISCIDFGSANDNKTTSFRNYDRDRWYKFRVQVTADMLIVYIDNEKVVNSLITDNKINVRLEMAGCEPFGFATWQTQGIVRNIKWRQLKPGEVPIDPDAY